jgi:hypothetical protein
MKVNESLKVVSVRANESHPIEQLQGKWFLMIGLVLNMVGLIATALLTDVLS